MEHKKLGILKISSFLNKSFIQLKEIVDSIANGCFIRIWEMKGLICEHKLRSTKIQERVSTSSWTQRKKTVILNNFKFKTFPFNSFNLF